MESNEAEDLFSIGPDGRPSKVTDYKLLFPEDFRKVAAADLSFITDANYVATLFRISAGQLSTTIDTLRKMKVSDPSKEYGIVVVKNDDDSYEVKRLLTGETGIGYQVFPRLQVTDFLHTHNQYQGEDEESTNLFSAFDLWKMGSNGAERTWLIGRDVVWTLVNYYGQRYYYSIKDACLEMARKYKANQSYEKNLSNLIECARKCQYRLYRSQDSVNYSLVS